MRVGPTQVFLFFNFFVGGGATGEEDFEWGITGPETGAWGWGGIWGGFGRAG